MINKTQKQNGNAISYALEDINSNVLWCKCSVNSMVGGGLLITKYSIYDRMQSVLLFVMCGIVSINKCYDI